MKIKIRKATLSDVNSILEIVNHAIANTTAIYDYDLRTLEEQTEWFLLKEKNNFPVFIAEWNNEILGFGTYDTFRTKMGYRFTVEHSIYVKEGFAGKGIGALLLQKLIDTAKEENYHIMIGVIDASNEKSIRFHEKFGFESRGILKEVGFKFNRWLDANLMQLKL
ncbi:GNAT family N-acetyltransferase [Flavobacterium sp.]|uniref:GNAT family N-acetyltransferase n=1 Tax=Flavobacterium sp. TaxID=239 RepID=UPI002611036A|nr:GNAT family N-acetyltransferase [Flavobacterium sp.]MDD3003519.1 GNAT family N-acetyltransferase [Flavobacterium sp.]